MRFYQLDTLLGMTLLFGGTVTATSNDPVAIAAGGIAMLGAIALISVGISRL